jgi:protein-S-isoprenylcysteine O-methyltransferase Ste14
VKDVFKQHTGRFFRYYRLVYSIFSTITLVMILYYQYSFKSLQLISTALLSYVTAFLLIAPGLAIMSTAVIKYFKLLSGIRSLYHPTPAAELKLQGIHKYVRHPLYLGTLLFVWGLFFLFPLVNNLIAVVIITAYVLIGIKFEEKKLVGQFGGHYTDYIKGVPRLIPRIAGVWKIKKGSF